MTTDVASENFNARSEVACPDRIRVAQDADGFWTCREAISGSQEYVRSDLSDAAELRAETYKRQFSEANIRAKNLTFRTMAMMDALRMADETFRDLGWHDKWEVTSAAIAKAEAL